MAQKQSDTQNLREAGSVLRSATPRGTGGDGSATRNMESRPASPPRAESQTLQFPGRNDGEAIEVLPRAGNQQDIPIGNSPVAVAGDAVYMLRLPTNAEAVPKLIAVARWKAGQLSTSEILESSGTDIYAGLGIGSSPDGDLYLALAHHTIPYSKPTSEIMKVDFERRTGTVIWSSSALVPRSFAVSRQGHIYIVGTTAADERATNKNPPGATINLLHIIDPAGNEIAALLPTFVARYSSLLGLMHNAVFTVRSNGNFVLTFNESYAAGTDFRDLVARDLKEYSPQGSLVQTHTFPDLPENVVVGAAAFDPEENLIVLAAGLIPSPGGKSLRWSGSYLIKESKSSLEQTRLFDFGTHESLIGILSDFTLLTRASTQVPGQWLLRFRTPFQVSWH